MGKTVLKKLRSRKGASLIFALLAFLVCAVVSAVLLASASAAAGRVSGLAASDQRYYAVTSAAQLFCDELDGQSFTVERKKVETKTEVTTYFATTNAAGEEITTTSVTSRTGFVYYLRVMIPGQSTATEISDFGADDTNNVEANTATQIANTRKASFLTDAVLSYVLGKQENLTVLNAYARDPQKADWVDRTWSIDVAVDGFTDLAVTATAKMTQSGAITIEFKNKEATEKNPFKILVTLTPEVDKVSNGTETRTTRAPVTTWDEDNDQSTTVTETDYVKTTVITWKVNDVIKVYGNAAAT